VFPLPFLLNFHSTPLLPSTSPDPSFVARHVLGREEPIIPGARDNPGMGGPGYRLSCLRHPLHATPGSSSPEKAQMATVRYRCQSSRSSFPCLDRHGWLAVLPPSGNPKAHTAIASRNTAKHKSTFHVESPLVRVFIGKHLTAIIQRCGGLGASVCPGECARPFPSAKSLGLLGAQCCDRVSYHLAGRAKQIRCSDFRGRIQRESRQLRNSDL
jgi:hypothetical protein